MNDSIGAQTRPLGETQLFAVAKVASANQKVAVHVSFQSLNQKVNREDEPHTGPPVRDNNLYIALTLKVANHPSQSRNMQSPSNPKPKKQPKTQTPTPESRNLSTGKSRNLKIQTKKPQPNKPSIKRKPKLTRRLALTFLMVTFITHLSICLGREAEVEWDIVKLMLQNMVHLLIYLGNALRNQLRESVIGQK